MTNFEKYKDEILKITAMGNSTPAMKDGMLVACKNLSCAECDFRGSDCIWDRFKWLCEDDGEEHDGCNGCKYEYKGGDESPCTECSMNYMSKFERRPKKTRQDEFLEMFPNAQMIESVVNICPKCIDGKSDRCANYTCISCITCHKDYWLQEVEE